MKSSTEEKNHDMPLQEIKIHDSLSQDHKDQISETNPFLGYLEKLLKGEIVTNHSKCRIYSYTGLKAGAIIVGSFSGVPYINIAMKFAGEYVFGGYILAYGIFTSLTTVTTWSLLDVVDAASAQSKEEKEISKKTISPVKEGIYWCVLPAIALTTASPISYLIYKYNNASLFYAGISIFTDTINNTCSLNRFFTETQTTIPFYWGNTRRKTLEKIRFLLIKQLEKSLEILPMLTLVQQKEILTADPKHLLYKLLSISKSQVAAEEQNEYWYQGLPRYLVKATSCIFPLSWAVLGVLNANELIQLAINSGFGTWFISIVCTAPYLMLEIALASMIFGKLYDLIIEKRFNTYNQSLARMHYPKTFFSLSAWGLLTTFSAFGPRAKIATDMVDGEFGIACAIFVSIGTVSYKSAAMLDLIKTRLEKYSIKYANDEIKMISKFLSHIRKFITLIAEAAPEKLDAFIDVLSHEQLAEVIPDNGALSSMLASYKKIKESDKTVTAHSEKVSKKCCNDRWYAFWENCRPQRSQNDKDIESRALLKPSTTLSGYVSSSEVKEELKESKKCCNDRWYAFWEQCRSKKSQNESRKASLPIDTEVPTIEMPPRNMQLPVADQQNSSGICLVM